MHDVTALIGALVPLAWPILAATVLWHLFPIIRDIAGKRSFEVEAAGMKVSVQAAADQLNRDIAELKAQVAGLREGRSHGDPPAQAGTEAGADTRHDRPTILWVDDNPSNNAFETAQFQQLGIEVLQAATTEQALRIVDTRPGIRAIISDMGRSEDGSYYRKAGLALLRTLRQSGSATPLMIYTSSRNLAEDSRASMEAGGAGAIASSTELLQWLRKTLG